MSKRGPVHGDLHSTNANGKKYTVKKIYDRV
jgi:hypothetical protein